MRRLLVPACLILLSPPAHAQVYKCVDAGGKTSYSQSPCPTGSKAAAINRSVPMVNAPAPAPTADAKAEKGDKAGAKPAGPKTAAELEQDFRKRREEQEKAQKKEEEKLAEAKVREENCRNSRLQLMNLDSGVPQSRLNEKGERSMLDEARLEEEKAQVRKLIEQWCK